LCDRHSWDFFYGQCRIDLPKQFPQNRSLRGLYINENSLEESFNFNFLLANYIGR